MKPTIADICAGIGGFRLGFEQAGFETVFSAEIDRFCEQTYHANFGKGFDAGDITAIAPESVPEHDILTAGFPCQSFSHAGDMNGVADERGGLFWHIARLVNAARPKAVLLENVKGLKSDNGGNTLQAIMEEFRGIGYTPSYRIINAERFVPQRRERIYIYAVRNDMHSLIFNWTRMPEPERMPVLADILEPDSDATRACSLKDKAWATIQRRAARGGKKRRSYQLHYPPFQDASRTLVRSYNGTTGAILIWQDGMRNPRKLTPRECARLMGFPDSFQIPVSRGRAYQQFGNSVVVPLIRHIATQLRVVMEE